MCVNSLQVFVQLCSIFPYLGFSLTHFPHVKLYNYLLLFYIFRYLDTFWVNYNFTAYIPQQCKHQLITIEKYFIYFLLMKIKYEACFIVIQKKPRNHHHSFD